MKRIRACGAAGIGLAAALLVLGPSAPACAQPPPPEAKVRLSPEAEEEGMRLYDEGRKVAGTGQWEKARELFMQAFALKRHYQIAAALGRAEVQLGKYRDAAEHLSWAIQQGGAEMDAAQRKAFPEMLEKARGRVGVLSISVDPPGAEVVVNGRSMGTAPLPGPVFVDAGPVIVEVRLEGYAPVRESRVALPGKEDAVRVALRKVAAVVPLAPVPVKVVSSGPNRAVLIAGSVLGAGGIIAGAALAAVSNGKASQSLETEKAGAPCGVYSMCRDQFTQIQQQKVTFGDAAIGAFATGGIVLAGTWIYGSAMLVSKRAADVKPTVSIGSDHVVGTVSIPW